MSQARTLYDTPATAGTLRWTGEVTPQKWMNFYTKVLSRFAAGKGLKLTVSVEARLRMVSRLKLLRLYLLLPTAPA